MQSLSDFLSSPDPAPDFLINPYLPRGGLVYLHGATSIGKSPLLWEIARCLSLGLPFFGHETIQGTVLFIEGDGPLDLLKPRLRLLPEPQGAFWLEGIYGQGVDLASPLPSTVARLR